MNSDNFTVLVSGSGRCRWVRCVVCGHRIQTERVQQWNCIKFSIKLEQSSVIQEAAAMGNWWLAASSQQCACSCITSHAEIFGKSTNHQVTQPLYSPDFAPCDFWLFPKLKSPLKGKRFQTIDEIQENTEQLMAIGKTVWGPMVPTLKGTEASLSYVQCFLYLVSSSRNMSIFHISRLDRSHMCYFNNESQYLAADLTTIIL